MHPVHVHVPVAMGTKLPGPLPLPEKHMAGSVCTAALVVQPVHIISQAASENAPRRALVPEISVWLAPWQTESSEKTPALAAQKVARDSPTESFQPPHEHESNWAEAVATRTRSRSAKGGSGGRHGACLVLSAGTACARMGKRWIKETSVGVV